MTFSSAVMLPNSRMFWNVRAIPACTTLRGFGGSRAPSNTTRPQVGRYSPVRQLKNVVLPAPLGPISPTISPAVDVEVHRVDGGQAAEPHGHVLGLQDRLAHGIRRPGRTRSRRSQRSSL